MRNQLVLCWSGSPSAFGYRMGWLRALLGQKLRSLSRSFAALFILFVRFGYPNLARGVLAEIRSHYARQQSNPSARMQKYRYHGDESKLLENYKENGTHIHNSLNQWISPSVNRQRIHRRSILNLVPQEHTVLRQRDVLSNVTLKRMLWESISADIKPPTNRKVEPTIKCWF